MAGRIVLALVGVAGDAASPPAGPAVGPLDVLLAVAAVAAIGLVAWRRWYRLPATPLPAPIVPEAGLVLFAAMMLLGLAGAQLAAWMISTGAPQQDFDQRPLSDHAIVLMGHVLGMAIASAGCVLVKRRAPRQRLTAGRAVWIGAATLAVIGPIMTCLSWAAVLIAEWIRGQPVDTIAHSTLRQLAATPPGPWPAVMALLVVIAVPVLEEVMYRGLLQRAIAALGLGRVTAIVGSSAIFVMMHLGTVEPHALPALLLLSLGLGWSYERTGRLVAPITMHVLFNAINLGLAWSLRGTVPIPAAGMGTVLFPVLLQ